MASKDIVRKYHMAPPEPWPTCQTCQVLKPTVGFRLTKGVKMGRYHVSKFGGVFGGIRYWYKCPDNHKCFYQVAHNSGEYPEVVF